MTLRNAFGDLALDTTVQQIRDLQEGVNNLNDTMLVLLSAILEKMPRVTGNDQAAVAIESGSVAISSGTVTNQAQIGGQEALTVARAQMIPFHIYNQIVVT